MEPQFPSNSKNPQRPIADRDEPKKVQRVVEGTAVRRKTPFGRRMTQNLIGGDVQSVWGFMFGEVLIPAARDMIYDAFTGGMERAIFGESTHGRSRGRRGGGHTPYNRYHQGSRGRDEPRRELSRHARSNHDFDEVVIPSRHEAQEVRDRLAYLCDKYGFATVSDFYELSGLSGQYTDQKWGWTDVMDVTISRSRSGYILNLPRPEPLD